jgi:hypothetical protein
VKPIEDGRKMISKVFSFYRAKQVESVNILPILDEKNVLRNEMH